MHADNQPGVLIQQRGIAGLRRSQRCELVLLPARLHEASLAVIFALFCGRLTLWTCGCIH